MILLYLFDIDGTLVHCHGAGRRAFERACQAVLGPGALRGIHLDGKTDPLILDEAFAARLGRTPTLEEVERVALAYEGLLVEEVAGPEEVRKLAGVDEALLRCEARGGVLGLATGNWRVGAQIKLSQVDLWSRFTLGGFGCDAKDRAELVRIARRRGEEHLLRDLSDDEVAVIGDTPRDISAAHAAGALALGVATGRFSKEELLGCGADAVYADLTALAAWLATLA